MNERTAFRSWVMTALLAVAFAWAACLIAAPDAHAAGENRAWLSNYNLPMEDGVPTLVGDYILSEDITGETFHIRENASIDLNGHTIDGNNEEEIGFTVDEGKTLELINSGGDAYVRNYEEHGVVLDDESILVMKKSGESGNVIISGCGEGAVLMDGDRARVDGGVISDNHIKGSWSRYTKGAGIYVDGDSCEVSNITIRDNYAHTSPSSLFLGTKSYGGGIYVNGRGFKASHFIIEDNHATFGGGVYVDGEDSLFTYGTFSENSAYVGDINGKGEDGHDGGAAYANEKGCYFEEVDFKGNTSARDGGAVYMNDISNAIKDCVLTGNKAVRSGGALFDDEGSTSVISCELIANTAVRGDGGAICQDSGTRSQLEGSTLRENLAGRDGGGMYIGSRAVNSMYNSAIEFNDCGDNGRGAGVCQMGGTHLTRHVYIRGNGGIKDDGSLAGGKTFSNFYVETEWFYDRLVEPAEIWIDTKASRRNNYPTTIYEEPNGEASVLDCQDRDEYRGAPVLSQRQSGHGVLRK